MGSYSNMLKRLRHSFAVNIRDPSLIDRLAQNGRRAKDQGGATLGPVLELMRLLWALDNSLQATSKRMATTLGVTGPQRLVIRILGRFPNISAGDLARILFVHPSTLTGVLRRLEEREILYRSHDEKDRRRSVLRLTPKGYKVDRLRSGTVEAAVRRAMAKMTAHQLKSAETLFKTLRLELRREST